MINNLEKVDKLPSSPKKSLVVKDYLKGLGLSALFVFAAVAPEIKQVVDGHDFGEYNEVIRFAVFMGGWLVQRYLKNNQI